MRIGDKDYSRAEVLRRVGNQAQIGGTRHYTLAEGRSKGLAAIDFDTGAGLRFTVLPDRGLDISAASYAGTNLVYLTPNGEVHPSYYDAQGIGWLHIFTGGLLTTCGLTYLGAPGKDGDEELGLHGRYAATPARQVCDLSRWEGDQYLLEVSGVMEEARLFGDKLRLTRSISTQVGAKSLLIHDSVVNIGYQPSPFTILYHINFGFPLLDARSRVLISAGEPEPRDDFSAQGLAERLRSADPTPGRPEQNYSYRVSCDAEGNAYAGIINPDLQGGLGIYMRFEAAALPFLNEWKTMADGDYVLALEPCNSPCANRAEVRQRGLLPYLAPGETKELRVTIGVLHGPSEISAFEERVRAIATP